MSSRTKHLVAALLAVVVATLTASVAKAQSPTLPNDTLRRVCYNMQMEYKQNCMSGICVIVGDSEQLTGGLVNEFGVAILNFVYDRTKDKMKLTHVMKPLAKWYIKRTLKRDLRQIMHVIESGGNEYFNSRRNINYTFNIMNDDATQTTD